jgi:hypothetical protein
MPEDTAPQTPSNTVEGKIQELYIEPAAVIDESNTHTDSETDIVMFNDEASIKLVLDNTALADNFINLNQWANGWLLADMLYQSPATQSAFDGGGPGQSCVPKYMVSNHISAIVPKISESLFYEDPCFTLRPRPGTSQDVVRAKEAIFSAQLDAMDFEEEVIRTLEQSALLGTGIMKFGYTEYSKKVKKFKRKADKKGVKQIDGSLKFFDSPESDDYEITLEDKKVSHPWIRFTDIRSVLVNPGCRVGDIRKAGWVVYRDYATYSDLNQLRDTPGYNIPAEDVLKQVFLDGITSGPDNISMTLPEGMMGYLQHAVPRSFKTSADPMAAPMEILEYWDNEKVIVVLCFGGHNILIRNEENPYGKIPFFSFNWRNIPDCFYGQGLGLLIGSEQIVEQGVTNLAMDLLAYCLSPMAVRKKGYNTLTQNLTWRQGGVIDVEEDVEKAFKFLQMPNVPSEAWTFIQQAQAAGAMTSGANEQVGMGAGAAGIKTTGMRSGTGAAAVVQANASRLDGPSGRFVRQVFTPWLYQMDDLDNSLMPTSIIKDILGEELGKPYLIDHMPDHIEYREAKIEYEVLAGSKLGAKKEMAQALPIIIQLLNNPTFVANANDAGYQFDAPAIFKAFTDAAGWKFSQNFLRKMTPQESQRHQANSPANLQQAQMMNNNKQAQMKFAQEQQMEDQKQLGKAGNEALRSALEHSSQSELTEGQPGNAGFGDTTQI